jgi:hypothetical protein
MGFLEKLAFSHGDKKEDIDKRKKKKKDAQVSGTLGVIPTLTNIKNLEQDVNVELFEFQDSFNHVAHKEDSPRTFKSRRGHVVKPSSHT